MRASDINANNPLDDLLDLIGDNGKEKPAYSPPIRKAAAGVKGAAYNSAEGKTDDVYTFSSLKADYYLVGGSTATENSTAAIPMLVGTKAGGLSYADNSLGSVVYKSLDNNPEGNGSGNENVKPRSSPPTTQERPSTRSAMSNTPSPPHAV